LDVLVWLPAHPSQKSVISLTPDTTPSHTRLDAPGDIPPHGASLTRHFLAHKSNPVSPTRPDANCPLATFPSAGASPAYPVGPYPFATEPAAHTDSLITPELATDVELAWLQSEPPAELSRVAANTPPEISRIIQDSLNHAKAVRNSTRKSAKLDLTSLQADSIPTSHQRNASKSSTQSTLSVSTASCSDSSQHSIESTTTVETSPEGDSVPNPQSQPQQSQQPPGPKSTGTQPFLELPHKQPESGRRGIFKMLRKEIARGTGHILGPLLSASPAETAPSKTVECSSCFDDVPTAMAIDLSCQHHYCNACFRQLVTTVMQNESFWPPKCCLQEIPKKTIQKHLPIQELAAYKLKTREYAVAAGSRWYCSRPGCGKWVERSKFTLGQTNVTCTHCKFQMCLLCRGETHTAGERCPSDHGLEATLAKAALEGWRQCYQCHTMVGLSSGCRHVTCRCGAQFW
jgi:hypothetical protein